MGPAMVRIVFHWQGTTTLPGYVIHKKNRNWMIDPTMTKPLELPYDFYSTGSGFIISPEGHILTNSHVVSDLVTRKSAAESLVDQYLLMVLFQFSATDRQWYVDLTSEERAKLREDGVKYLISTMVFNTTPNLHVLKPTTETATTTSVSNIQKQLSGSAKQRLDDILKNSSPASAVYINEEYAENEHDFAVIKLTELSNVPSVQLGDSSTAATGQSIYTFGYPTNADYGTLSTEPTFTSGVITSLRDSTQHTFKYIQTDAKISSGSSGSPLFDSNGDVIGILTKTTNSSNGENFTLALPINIIKDTLGTLGLGTPQENDYPSLLALGFAAYSERHCKDAMGYFDRASEMNSSFGDPAALLEPYYQKCKALIASGQSIDGWWDVLRNWVVTRGTLFWVVTSGAGVVTLGGSTVVYLLLRRVRHEEEVIAELEAEVHHHPVTPAPVTTPVVTPAAAATPIPVATPAAVPVITNPQLALYVQNMRNLKQPDEQIQKALAAAGYKVPDILAALAVK